MIPAHYTWAFAINFVIKFILSMQGKLSRLFCINLLISLLSPPCIRFVCNHQNSSCAMILVSFIAFQQTVVRPFSLWLYCVEHLKLKGFQKTKRNWRRSRKWAKDSKKCITVWQKGKKGKPEEKTSITFNSKRSLTVDALFAFPRILQWIFMR